MLAAHALGPKYIGSQSTQMTISASQFFNNEQLVVWHGDTLTVEDVWVSAAATNIAAIWVAFFS